MNQNRRPFSRQLMLWIGALVLLVSCSTYQNKVTEPRNLLKSGQITEALEKFKALADKPGDDQLVYLMEYGTALQIAGQYRESNQVFLKADKLADQADYHSVSNITMAALGSEEMIQYKGESYEKLLINASLALNYTMLGQTDDAIVEARRINEKITKIRHEGRSEYEQNPFAHYLSGLLWEADQKYDDAYISFEQSAKIDRNGNPELPKDLIRSSKRARRDDTYKKWKKEYPKVQEDPDWYNKNLGEIDILIEQGWGPQRSFGADHRIPKLYPVPSITQSVRANLTGMGRKESAKSTEIYDVEQVAIRTLDADYGWMVARKIGAFAAKEVVADQIRQKNEVLGLIALIGMHASDRADLRQWSTLPQTVQLIRFWVPAGTYQLDLQGLDGSGAPTEDRREKQSVQVKPGRKSFYFWRTLH